MRENIIKEKTFDLAVNVVNLCRELAIKKNEFVLSNQLMKSGTSIGANTREALNAESDKDFIHKFSISQKETNETIYWLDLLEATGLIDKEKYNHLIDKCKQIYKIITSIILTKKRNLRDNS